MSRVTSLRAHRAMSGAAAESAPPASSTAAPPASSAAAAARPAFPSAWRQIGIGVAVVVIGAALVGTAAKLLSRPAGCTP